LFDTLYPFTFRTVHWEVALDEDVPEGAQEETDYYSDLPPEIRRFVPYPRHHQGIDLPTMYDSPQQRSDRLGALMHSLGLWETLDAERRTRGGRFVNSTLLERFSSSVDDIFDAELRRVRALPRSDFRPSLEEVLDRPEQGLCWPPAPASAQRRAPASG
jgi:hypothetical protein